MLNPTKTLLIAVLALGSLGPVAADDDEDIRLYMQGRYVFGRHCAVCHGKTGRGDGELAKGVTIKPRDFRKGVFKFRTTPMGKLPTDDDLKRTIRSGVSGSMMPTFALSESDLRSVLEYIKALSRRWADPDLKVGSTVLPATPGWLTDGKKHRAHADEGRAVFKIHCANCHGEGGKGDGSASKGLKDIWGDPIGPADLSSQHHRGGDSPSDLFRTIAMGLDGTPMIGFLKPLGAEKIWDLVAFIETLSESGAR